MKGDHISIKSHGKFMFFYSTIDRKRGTTKVYFVGNTISKVNPYIREWGLDSILKRIKQGEIKTKEYNNDGFTYKIAMEYCKPSGGKSVAIGNSSESIDKGAWVTNPQPKLPESYNNYKVIYRVGFCFKGFKFLGELLIDKNSNICWFIRPFTSDFSNDIIVISDEIKVEKNWQRNIYGISIKNPKLQALLNTFTEEKIFYSSDLCGTDFKQVIDFLIRR